MKFSIGYNEQPDFYDILNDFSENISTVYFAAPSDLIPSGRPIVQDENYDNDLIKLIQTCNKLGIGTILTLNATTEGVNTGDKDHMLNIISYIKKLKKYGLTSVSLTNLLYVKFIKKAVAGIEIYSSVNCYVKTVEQAIYLKNLGIDILTIDRDINRDLDLIKKIKARSGLKIQVMLNEGCVKNCPFRHTHFNIIANQVEDNISNQKKGKYNLIERFSCTPLVAENKRIIFRMPIIRPEDLQFFDGIGDYFKLVTRGLPTEKIRLMLDSYSKGYYHGNLFDILDMSIIDYHLYVPYIDNDKLTKLDFFHDLQKCPGDCDTCTNCDKYF